MKKLAAILAVIVAAIAIPATLFAWGPTRPTYTIARPADHITFNSITDNPNIGDERNFVGIRESGTSNLWSDNITVQSGREYTVRMYVHNNAAQNLNLVAQNVTAKFNLPTTTGRSIQVNGFINSSNATPNEVYDHAVFNASEDFNLAVVPNSIIMENNIYPGPTGIALSNNIFTSQGVLLGYDSLNGRIPGCMQYAAYVSFRVRPQFAQTSSFAVNKRVSRHGANSWSKTYNAQPGETVDFMLEYRNTGTSQQDNVTFRDTLATGMTYVNGSTRFGNSNFPNGVAASDNIANGTGINVGSYRPNANAWAIFSARIAANDALPTCGVNNLVNNMRATTGGGSMSSDATVTVTKTCTTPVPPTTPTELPQTGIESLASVLGLGTVATGAGYYVTSRRRA